MLSDNMMLGGAGPKAAYPMENALLFRGAQYLSRTPSVAGDVEKWTFSFWMRRGALSDCFIIGTVNGNGEIYLQGNALCIDTNGVSRLNSTALFRDPTAWYHIVYVYDAANTTAVNRIRLYVNGVEITTFAYDARSGVAAGQSIFMTGVVAQQIGRYAGVSNFDGYIAEPVLADGAALTPSSFGEIDPVTLSWRPKVPVVPAWGTNGFYLGKPWNSASLGADTSGRGNNWTPSGFDASDVVADTPTNVFATLNPLAYGYSASQPGAVKDGNLVYQPTTPNTYDVKATFSARSGKCYWEVKWVSGDTGIAVGVMRANSPLNGVYRLTGGENGVCYESQSGNKFVFTARSIYGSPWTVGDVIGVALDADGGTLTFYRNGVSQGGISIGLDEWVPAFGNSGAYWTIQANFGQKPFAYTPPAGFKSLCTANLPATTGITSGSFTGNATADGPFVYTGAVPVTLTINGNAVTWATHADKAATGFKLRSANASYNASGINSWVATYNKKPTVGSNHTPANAQGNP